MILNEGWEYVFILAVAAVTVAMLGPLEWSIDHAIGWDDELDGYTGLVISAGGGVAAAAALDGAPSTGRRQRRRTDRPHRHPAPPGTSGPALLGSLRR